jgi:succinyl-CoA synthetase alpha subunit
MKFTPESKTIVQGIVEPLGSTHAGLMKAYGTNIVAGVSPGYGGKEVSKIPVFDLVEQAVDAVGAIDTTIIFVDPFLALDAALEAIAAGVRQIVIVTEGMPPLDMVRLVRKAEATDTLVVGPNCPGIVVPEKVLLGTHPVDFYTPGSVGLISRSGTLTYEVALTLSEAKLGQSIGVGIGGDTIIGSSFAQWLQILEEDENTEAIVLVGEIGGGDEETAAQYVAEAIDKPVVAYIAGRHAPIGKRFGHAGAIVAAHLSGADRGSDRPLLKSDIGTAERKFEAFKQAKIPVADRISDLPDLVKKALKKKKK